MSTSQEQQQQEGTIQAIECKEQGCDRVGRPWTFQHGYCSTDHWHRHEGRTALSGLKYSHTRCFTCLATLKHIEKPKPNLEFRESGVELTYNPEKDFIEAVRYAQEETRRAACGFQYLTPEADIGEKNAGRKIVMGTVCGECGAADHTEHISLLADGHRTAGLVVDYLTTEDEDDFDAEVLHRRYVATGDLELAAGAAIVACRD